MCICICPFLCRNDFDGRCRLQCQFRKGRTSAYTYKKLNPFFTAQHITDKNNTENLKYFLRGNVELKDRTLAFFSDSTYAVMYNEDKCHVWYYTNSGKLIYTEVKDGLNYPYKSYKFNTAGKLINMGLRVSKGETFIYSPNGKLIAHWLGQYAYDEKGNIIMSRKYSD